MFVFESINISLGVKPSRSIIFETVIKYCIDPGYIIFKTVIKFLIKAIETFLKNFKKKMRPKEKIFPHDDEKQSELLIPKRKLEDKGEKNQNFKG